MSKARGLADLGNVFDDGALSNRNLIINGAMQVWQRGTSSSSAGYSSVDRYEMSGTSTRSRSSDAPSGFQYSLQQALTSGNANQLEQFIEAANAVQLEGKTATLSFYAKASGSVEMYLYASTFSTIDDSSTKSFFITNQTIGNATSSWVRYTVEIDYSAQTNVANGCGILIGFRETGNSSATAYITGVQLEVGDTATPFEHRSYGDELQRCQRYYEKLTYTGGYQFVCPAINVSTLSVEGLIPFNTQKRVNPTVSSSAAGTWRVNALANDTTAGTVGWYTGTVYAVRGVWARSTGTHVMREASYINVENSSPFEAYIEIDAEL